MLDICTPHKTFKGCLPLRIVNFQRLCFALMFYRRITSEQVDENKLHLPARGDARGKQKAALRKASQLKEEA